MRSCHDEAHGFGDGPGTESYMSYDIVTQGHGGTLAVESEAGDGATFMVTLPVGAEGT